MEKADSAVRPEARVSNRARILAGALVLAAILVRIPGLGRSLWYDELFTYRKFLDSFLHAFARQREANNHPLASVLAWAARRLAGSDDPVVLRAPSVLLGALAVLAIAWLAGRRSSRTFSWAAAGAAAALALVHPTLVGYSQEVRGYAGLLLADPIVVGLALALLSGGDRRLVPWLVLATGVGLFAHLTLGILVLGLAAYAYLAKTDAEAKRTTLIGLSGGLGLGLLLYAPILVKLWHFATQFTFLNETRFGGPPTLDQVGLVGEMLSMNYERLLHRGQDGALLVSPWILAALLLGLIGTGVWASLRDKDHLALATATVVVTTGLIWVAARPLSFARFFLFLLPPLLALAARGAEAAVRATGITPRAAVLAAGPVVLIYALETNNRVAWEIQPVDPALRFARGELEPELGPPCIVGLGAGLVDPSLDFRPFASDQERDIATIDAACAPIDSGTRSTLVVIELYPGRHLLRPHVLEALMKHRLQEEKAYERLGLVSDVYVHVLRRR